jgi:hypothetical protein
MLLNNQKKGMVFHYQIQYAQDRWFAWYFDTSETSVQNLIDQEKQNQDQEISDS